MNRMCMSTPDVPEQKPAGSTCSTCALRPRLRAVPTRATTRMAPDEPEQPRDGKSLLDAIGDASFDMFVMPGEAANSRYDRPLSKLEDNETAAFDWGGDTAESEALRLPSGVKAAQRLTVPVSAPKAQWFERQGPSSDPAEMRRRIDEDTQRLSSEWTRLWAVCVVITLVIVAGDSLPPPG